MPPREAKKIVAGMMIKSEEQRRDGGGGGGLNNVERRVACGVWRAVGGGRGSRIIDKEMAVLKV